MSRLLLLLALPITLSIALYKPYKDFSSPDMASLSALRASAGKFPGRKALVVGGTSGLGEGIAVRLAKAEFDVLIAGRNAEAGRRVVEEMERARDGNGTPGSFKFEKLDASVLANVKEFTEEYEKKEGKLDVLVLTQGIASLAGRTETAEGVDVKMSLHYYSRMAFIQQLLPLLRASPSPRVLTVLSGGIHSPLSPELVSTDPELKSSYSLKHAADAAGYYTNLALERFSADPRNAKIEFVHAAPGAVATNWGSEFPWPLPTLINILKPMLMTKEDAAEYLCKELLRPDTAVTPGLVVQNPKARPSKVTAGHTDEMREKVWRSTVDVWSRGGIRISA